MEQGKLREKTAALLCQCGARQVDQGRGEVGRLGWLCLGASSLRSFVPGHSKHEEGSGRGIIPTGGGQAETGRLSLLGM